MSACVELSGRSFGLWLVLGKSTKRGSCGDVYWKCRCACGKTSDVSSTSLRQGKSKGCHACRCVEARMIDLTGKVFGSRTVIGYDGVHVSASGKTKKHYWLCRCECGKESSVERGSLVSGRACICRMCSTHKQGVVCGLPILPKGQAAANLLLSSYKRAAKARGREWGLTDAEFHDITTSDCHYCGCRPGQIKGGRYVNGDHRYNGADRIDNSIGYTPANVVPCCGTCNIMKGRMDKLEFIKKAKEIARYSRVRKSADANH